MLKIIENEAVALAQNPHLYEILALQEGVRLFRAATPADLSAYSDQTVLQMIRAVCGDGGHCANLGERIDSDHKAILRALNCLAKSLQESCSGSDQ